MELFHLFFAAGSCSGSTDQWQLIQSVWIRNTLCQCCGSACFWASRIRYSEGRRVRIRGYGSVSGSVSKCHGSATLHCTFSIYHWPLKFHTATLDCAASRGAGSDRRNWPGGGLHSAQLWRSGTYRILLLLLLEQTFFIHRLPLQKGIFDEKPLLTFYKNDINHEMDFTTSILSSI